jgi:hypothetical protein
MTLTVILSDSEGSAFGRRQFANPNGRIPGDVTLAIEIATVQAKPWGFPG